MASLLENIEKKIRSKFKILPAPVLDYGPPQFSYPVRIGIVGDDDEAYYAVTGYLRAGYEVTAFADPDIDKMKALRDRFYPSASVHGDHRALLDARDVDFVYVSPPSPANGTYIRDALKAGKHVLCQRLFVDDLNDARELMALAEEKGVKLAVTQDALFCPHYSYALQLVRQGYAGDISAIYFTAIWNHHYIKDTPQDGVKYSVLYDFGINWFNLINAYMGYKRAESVFGSVGRPRDSQVKAPLLFNVIITYPEAQTVITLNGAAKDFVWDRTVIHGTKGIIGMDGPGRSDQGLWFFDVNGGCYPELEGDWYPGSFQHSMAELVKAVEEDREPENSAAHSSQSFELCFAAIASSELNRPVVPGDGVAQAMNYVHS